MVEANSKQSKQYEDEFYPISYDYVSKRTQILGNLIDYFKIEQFFNFEKDFKFGIVVQKTEDRKTSNNLDHANFDNLFSSDSKHSISLYLIIRVFAWVNKKRRAKADLQKD